LPQGIIVQFACIWHKSFFFGDPKITTARHFVTNNNLESHQAAMLASDDSWNDKTSKRSKQMKNSLLAQQS
jgi:hypothetical protein